jgi:hypothetical protein
MSSGIVVCSKCNREVHQDGDMLLTGSRGWRHCEDKTARCPGASSVYPNSVRDIKGPYCGRDDIG